MDCFRDFLGAREVRSTDDTIHVALNYRDTSLKNRHLTTGTPKHCIDIANFEAATIIKSHEKKLIADPHCAVGYCSDHCSKFPSQRISIDSISHMNDSNNQSIGSNSPEIAKPNDNTSKLKSSRTKTILAITALIVLSCAHGIISFILSCYSCGESSIAHHQPVQFDFHPPHPKDQQESVLKSAIITIYPANESRTSISSDLDFKNTLMLAYSILHNPNTRLSKPDLLETELIVAYTGNLSLEKQNLLFSLGVTRLLPLPTLEIVQGTNLTSDEHSFKPCPENSCFSKLYLFGLEGRYKRILYLDPTVLPLKPLSTILNDPIIRQKSSRNLFASVQALGMTEGVFDSGMMLFTPSLKTFHRLMNQVAAGKTAKFPLFYRDQGLLNLYFAGGAASDTGRITSCQPWTRLPSEYHTQQPQLRDATILKNSVTINHLFWSVKSIENSPIHQVFESWRQQMLDLHRHLEQTLSSSSTSTSKSSQSPKTQPKPENNSPPAPKPPSSNVSLTPPTQWPPKTMTPNIPTSWRNLNLLLETNTLTTRIVIHTLLTKENRDAPSPHALRVLQNRNRYIQKHPAIAYHFFQNDSHAAVSPVWQKAYDAELLLGEFDWVWLLDAGDAFIMNDAVDLRVLLGTLLREAKYQNRGEIDIVMGTDMNGLNAGSFFIRASEWSRDKFIPAWKAYEKVNNEQWAIWEMMRLNQVDIQKHMFQLDYSRKRLFNSYTFGAFPFQEGDFVVHAPSLGAKGLSDFLKEKNLKEVKK